MNSVIILDGIVPEVERTAFDVFSHSDFSLLEPYIKQVREYAKTVDRSIDTPQQRKQLASEAYKIAKLKTAIEKIGADESKRVKEIPKAIDANRRLLKESLEQVQMWVREPLTKWEEEEKERVDKIQDKIKWFNEVAGECHHYEIHEVESYLAKAAEHNQELDLRDLADQFNEAQSSCIQVLTATLEQKQKAEAERQELERLRAQAAENERLAQVEKTKQEAAEQARLQAEREAEQKLEAERLRIREMELQAQRDKEAQEQALRDAEAARLQAVEDARLQAESAEKARKLALEKAEQDRLAAIEAERQRVEAEQLKVEAEAKARAEDLAHRATINNKVVADLVANADISEDQAKSIVIAVAKGLIGNVIINY